MLQILDSITDPTIRERVERLIVKAALKAKLFLGVALDRELNREQLAKELFKEYRRPPTYLQVKVFHKGYIYAADLVEMPTEKLGRSGTYKYILTCIDLYT